MFSLRMIFKLLHAIQSCARIFTLRMWTKYPSSDPKRPDVVVDVSAESVLLAEDPRPLLYVEPIVSNAEETL